MTFREAFLLACELNPKATKGQKRLLAKARAADPRRPVVRRLWVRMEKAVERRYRKDTGHVAAIDWQAIIDWLVANLPAILQIIMAILMLF